MSKKTCYFKCKHEGQLYNFPPMTYTSYEKYCKWKDILRKEDKEKGDYFISHNLKLCNKHFEKYYITPNNHLMRHAVPTLKLGITLQQEELLCSLIEANPNLVMAPNLDDQMVDKLKEKWKTVSAQLNALGSEKTCDAWAEYLHDVVTNLKSKEVVWIQDTSAPETNKQNIRNINDFTELELGILQLEKKGVTVPDSPEHIELDFREENEIDMEYVLEDGDSDSSRNSETSRVSWSSKASGTTRVKVTSRDNEITNEIVTFTLNVATGGHKPLLQAAEIAPYEAPQDNSNVKCKCKHSHIEVEDEFDAFGKDIAQQLRSMPMETALETRKLLMSVLRSKQSKVLNHSFLLH